MKIRLASRDGFSLIEALIALGLVGVLGFVIAEMMANSAASARSLSDKLEILQLKDLMIRVMADGDVCTKVLGGSTPRKSFDPNDSAAEIVLSSIPMSSAAGASDLIAIGSKITNHTQVSKITVSNFRNTGNTNEYLSQYNIHFTTTGSGLPPKPLTYQAVLYTQDDIHGNKEILACANTQLSYMERVYFYFGTSASTGNKYYCNPTCNWTVPTTAKGPAFITIAGGGASAVGPLVLNKGSGGHSGGYLMNAPTTLTPGSMIAITVGYGGEVFTAPYVAGVPGGESRFGTIYSCSGGGAPTECGVLRSGTENMTSLLNIYGPAGMRHGYSVGSTCDHVGVDTFPGAVGEGTTGSEGPGRCGGDGVGVGNSGSVVYASPTINSGTYPGGKTPLGFGSGGDDFATGHAFTPGGLSQPTVGGVFPATTIFGTSKSPQPGRPGVVIVDYMK